MQRANPVRPPQIVVKTARIVRHLFRDGGSRQRQRTVAALRPDNIAVAIGIRDAPLVAVHGDKGTGDRVQVVGLLRPPPAIFIVVTHVVIRDHDVIEGGRIQTVTVQVHEGAVADAVQGNIGVPVQVAAVDVIYLAAGVDLVVADARDLFFLVGVYPY